MWARFWQGDLTIILLTSMYSWWGLTCGGQWVSSEVSTDGGSGCPSLNVTFNIMVGSSTLTGHSSNCSVNWQHNRMIVHQLHIFITHKYQTTIQWNPNVTFPHFVVFAILLIFFVRYQPNVHKNNVSCISCFPRFYAILGGPRKT